MAVRIADITNEELEKQIKILTHITANFSHTGSAKKLLKASLKERAYRINNAPINQTHYKNSLQVYPAVI